MLLLTGAALGIARPAAAQTFKVTATGTITNVSGFNSSVAIDTPYTFSFLYDYSVPNISSDPTFGEYDSRDANYGPTVAFGDYKFTPFANELNYLAVGTGNGQTAYNGFNLVSLEETATGLRSGAYVQLEGESSTGFFSSTAMPPLSSYNVANFDFLQVALSGPTASDYGFLGSVTSLSAQLVNPVPEASTTVSLGVMLGLGGLALGMRRRRKA